MIAQTLHGQKRFRDLFIMARYMYRVDEPIMSDGAYEKMESVFRKNGVLPEYLERTYDDDPIPYNLLAEFGIKPEEGDAEAVGKLTEDRSLSIKPVINYRAAYERFKAMQGRKLLLSPKFNGVNVRSRYVRQQTNSSFDLSLSRGRTGLPFNLTENVSRLTPPSVGWVEEDEFVAVGEAFVMTEALPLLRQTYDPSKYKTEKGAALSMLRVPHKNADYKHLKLFYFSCPEMGNSASANLKKLDALGFEVVPHLVVEEYPLDSLESFKEWLDSVLYDMHEMCKEYPTDGVVVEVDDLSDDQEIEGQYSSRNFALKLSFWSHQYYAGVVKSVITTTRKSWSSCVVEIEPKRTNDNTTAKRVNVYNPSILFENNLYPGATVFFERNSGAYNVLLRKGLKEIELGEEESNGAEKVP